jgi:hypothetical protein
MERKQKAREEVVNSEIRHENRKFKKEKSEE